MLSPSATDGGVEMEEEIRIMVADDMPSHVKRLVRMIEQEPDFLLVCTASSGKEAVEKAAEFQPDIILMDISMETQDSGVTAAQDINMKYPEIKIIMLTVHEDDEVIFSAFQAGVVDYLIKTEAITATESYIKPALIVDYLDKTNELSQIASAIRNAYHHQSTLQPKIAEKLRQEFRRYRIKEQNFLTFAKIISTLTASEFEILKLLYEGNGKKDIARLRFVEVDTVKKQIHSILKKCGQTSTKRVLALIQETGLFEQFLGHP